MGRGVGRGASGAIRPSVVISPRRSVAALLLLLRPTGTLSSLRFLPGTK